MPSLYFMQGIPVVIVQQMAVTMYKSLGVDNARIGLWTSLISWPWIVKMLWGPLVDGYATKRGWIVWTQALLIVLLGISAVALGQPNFLAATLVVFFLVAFVSATHDIAADGFYILSLPESLQATFVGIRSAFFRLAMVFCTGGLVVLAGRLQAGGMAGVPSWTWALLAGTAAYAVLFVWGLIAYPRPEADMARAKPEGGKILLAFLQIVLMLGALFLAGRLLKILSIAATSMWKPGEATALEVVTPLFAPRPGMLADANGMVSLASGKLEKLEVVQAMFGTWSPVEIGVQYGTSLGLIALAAWSTVRLFHRIGMGPAAKEYFSQSRILAILGFILFYRFGESMISKLSTPFLIDPPEKGGLGVPLDQVGVLTGTVGVVALTLGGLLGGWLIGKYGIKRCIWPMVMALNVPNLFYVWAAYARPGVGPVGLLIGVDQFGYGFGFSAYMVYLMFLSQGAKNPTSHYAISTGLMAFGAMIAGISSGYAQTYFAAQNPGSSYALFFVAVCVLAIPGMLMLLLIPMDKDDLRVSQVEID